MAEEFVSRDQHRADLTQLRLELANTLASLDKRTELIAQDLASLRRETQQGLADVRREMSELRQDTRQGMQDLRAEMRELRSTTMRQMWAMISVVTFAVLTGLIQLVFFK